MKMTHFAALFAVMMGSFSTSALTATPTISVTGIIPGNYDDSADVFGLGQRNEHAAVSYVLEIYVDKTRINEFTVASTYANTGPAQSCCLASTAVTGTITANGRSFELTSGSLFTGQLDDGRYAIDYRGGSYTSLPNGTAIETGGIQLGWRTNILEFPSYFTGNATFDINSYFLNPPIDNLYYINTLFSLYRKSRPGDGWVPSDQVAGGSFTQGTIVFNSGSVSAVPEPDTWFLLLTGLLGVGLSVRRKRGLVDTLTAGSSTVVNY